MEDHYDVLQVNPRAEPEVIRAAYRVLARKYHPDHGGDAARMIALNDAWDVLGDADRRAVYDASRRVGGSRSAPPPPPPAPGEPAAAPPAGPASPAGGFRSEAAPPRDTDAGHAGPPPGRPS